MIKDFFPIRPNITPTIYAYSENNPIYQGYLKVGFTTKNARMRVSEQYPTIRPSLTPYQIEVEEEAIRADGSTFTDRDVHRYLETRGVKRVAGEWFECTPREVKAAILAVKNGVLSEENRTLDFYMRPEQHAAVEKTAAYFTVNKRLSNSKPPHFLWNAKMRFGKTFATYQLAKKMGWKKLLVLTFKPAVQSAWESDLKEHIDFAGWHFISPANVKDEGFDSKQPFVLFGSFQDYLGHNREGGIKAKNEWVHATHWDCVVLDEYHYGAWREKAKDLFEAESEHEQDWADGEGLEYFDEELMPITTNAYLYLSGTPFRAIATGEFIEEQIYNWTYSDEQRAKQEWQGEDNPYACLPRMVMLTYQLPPAIAEIARKGEFNEFDLNTFFTTEGKGKTAKFLYENEVQNWLDLIRGQFLETTVDNLKLGAKKPPMPFSDVRLLSVLNHTLWFLPSVAACYAMKNLIDKRQNIFYHNYEVVVTAGQQAGIGVRALPPVYRAMDNPLKTKTITLSCGKLTTGVTVRPWTGIFMLRNSSSPETYFQAAFRVQSPWVIHNPDGISPNKQEIMKQECYIFDFAPNRALHQIQDYSCRLNLDESNPELKVADFIRFLPVLAYDGSSMQQLDAAAILDIALTGISDTMLARRWESALLVNVDNETLRRLMNDSAAMKALMNIEGFRSLNKDLETIINKSEAVKKVKKESTERDLTEKEKKELTEEEKKYKSMRKQIQEKLIKFATRIPVFMYLTDYREHTLKDIITQLEPGLFKKVTGLEVTDFGLLVSLGVFNSGLMNDAVYKFKLYEDPSLVYTGVNKHEGEKVGLYDTVLNNLEYQGMIFENLSSI